jgi:hypothetical protein
MRGDNTFLFLIVGIVLLHFLLGFGWLVYKLVFGGKKKNNKEVD